MAQKVKAGEERQAGWLYFVKGENLELWKAPMSRGKKRSKAKKSSKKRKR